MNLEARVTMICNRNNLPAPVTEALEYGYSRVRVDARSWGEFEAVKAKLHKMKSVKVVRTWHNGDGGYFEGAVWVQDVSEYEAYTARMAARNAYLEDWWQRYHVADDATRRLMACGAIA